MAELSIPSAELGLAKPTQATPPPPTLDPTAEAKLAQLDPGWAWAPYKPAADRPWNLTLTAHLYRRAGFGANWTELQRALARGPKAAVDTLFSPPEAARDFIAASNDYETAAARTGDAFSLTAWWLRRLVGSPDPLHENLVLFWHNHFAIAASAVADLPNFHRHLQRLHRGAMGDFAPLFRSLLDDPAMYVALVGEQNRRSQPNLPFARPWLETFTVGPGIGSERDVADLARCFTGWFVYGGKLRFIEREYDDGDKEILGRAGRFGRDDLVEILTAHPATARNLARRLFRWFVSETVAPGDAFLEPLAASLRQPNGIRAGVELILRSNLFFSDHALLQKIKSPVELAVGLARSLEAVPPTVPIARDLVNLGQRLDEPPTVHGWTGGVDWINSITIASRLKLCRSMLEGSGDYGKGLDPWAVAERHGPPAAPAAAQLCLDLLVQNQLASATRDEILGQATASKLTPERLRGIVAAIVSQPEFQLS